MGPDSMGKFEQVHIKSIHRKRLPVQEVVAGQAAAFALKKIKKNQVRKNGLVIFCFKIFLGTKGNSIYWARRRSAESCLGISRRSCHFTSPNDDYDKLSGAEM